MRPAGPPRLLPEQPFYSGWLQGLLAAVLLFNLADAVLTMVWLMLGAATEANPLMAPLVSWGPVPFMLAKLVLVSAGILVLWHYRRHSIAVIGALCVFLVYYIAVIHHLRALVALLQEMVSS